MDIRKNLIIVFVLCLIALPSNAGQFKQWQGVIVNKQAVSHIVPITHNGKSCIKIYYMAGTDVGNGDSGAIKSILTYSDATLRNQSLKQMTQWLNEKI